MTDMATCQEYRPTPSQRFWRFLGFRAAYTPLPDDPMWEASSFATDTYIHLDWRDRLRALISGKLNVASRIKTDVVVNKAQTISTMTVLPPFYPMKGPRS